MSEKKCLGFNKFIKKHAKTLHELQQIPSKCWNCGAFETCTSKSETCKSSGLLDKYISVDVLKGIFFAKEHPLRKRLEDRLAERQKDLRVYVKLAHWEKIAEVTNEDEKLARICSHRVKEEIEFLKDLLFSGGFSAEKSPLQEKKESALK